MPAPDRYDWPLEAVRVEEQLAAGLRAKTAQVRVAEKRTIELERRNAVLEAGQRTAVKVTSEPLTYHRGGQHSFFYDLARARRSINTSARERLARHERELDVEMPKRAEARARAAAAAYESAFYSTPEDRRAVDQMIAAGVNPFERRTAREQRAINRVDGSGGYFGLPLFLVDAYVAYAREASPFADQWKHMELPPATAEINIPRMALGAATGPQADLQAAPTRDITDSLVSTPVKTIAGIADAATQWLEQGQGSGGFGVDDVIFADLTADLHQNIDGQLLLGSGTGGQLLGVWPSGAIAAANGIIVADASNTASQSWTVNSSGTTLHVYAAQMVSLLRRIRARSDGLAWFWHPWVWSLYLAQVDSQGRPVVLDQDVAGLPPGAVGWYQNIPVFCDSNIATTFGGSTTPQMGTISAGQYAANAGTGTGASYTPLLLARPQDLFLYAGDIRVHVLSEVLSADAMVRFQAFQYLAAMPNRFVAGAAVGSNVSAGGDVAHATLTWNVSNSLLILSGSGY